MRSENQPQRSRRTFYEMPTRLNMEDKLISLGPFSLTLRQGFVLVIGGCVAVNVWKWLDLPALDGTSGFILHVVVTCLPLLLALLVAFVSVTGRYPEAWALLLWRYWRSPKVYLWKRKKGMLVSPSWPRRKREQPRREQDAWRLDEESEQER
jgi:hypothetical protein